MKKKWGAAAAAAALVLLGARLVGAAPDYSVILPEGYDGQEERNYPVVYLLPEDGASGVSDAVREGLRETFASQDAMDAILVEAELPDPSEETIWEWARELVGDVDSEYRTVPEAGARAVAGEGIGGYLADILVFSDEDGAMRTEPGLFSMSGAISPDYQADSAWREQSGDVVELLESGPMNNAAASRFYTFIRTASEEEQSYEEKGANDVIAALIRMGAAYGGVYDAYYGNADNTVLDLVIRHGEDDEEFRKKAAHEMAVGFSRRIMSTLISGSLSVTPQAAKADLESVSAGYSLTLSPSFTAFAGKEDEIGLVWTLKDPATDEPLADAFRAEITAGEGETSGQDSARLPNLVEEEHTDVVLSASLLGAEVVLDTRPLVRIGEPGQTPEEQAVDLMGAWKFLAQPQVTPGQLPEKETYDAWEEVIPCLGWWAEDFSRETNMKAYAGYAWYIKEFDIPEDFPEGSYHLPLGGFDETDMVWVNGERIGYTGLNGDSWQHEEDKWDTIRDYELDSSILHIGGSNEIIVLTHNASGDGGWYSGHPGLYTEAAYQALVEAGADSGESRFLSVTIPSACKAEAMGSGAETEEESFLVYLPEGYDDPENADKTYPTAYLLHQLNSSSHSYVVDGIDRLLDQGIAEGSIGELIVVIPDSAPESWWMGSWEKMVTGEILPYVDENFRTRADEKHRFIAGASMGGHGAYHIGLSHPELFSGIISYFGAINMGANPLSAAMEADDDYLGRFRHYFVCGNRDLYKFGIPAIALDRRLREAGVKHFFELEEGEHDSRFYLPYFVESFGYMTDGME